MAFDASNGARHVLPADQLPTAGFMGRRKYLKRDMLTHLVLRLNAGNLSHLNVPTPLVYRLASLCRRWAPDLQVFITQTLEASGHLDHFLTQPAATDHHTGPFGLLESSITAAELAMRPGHNALVWQPLPRRVDELQQVCSAVAFLFDLGKVYDTHVHADMPRAIDHPPSPISDLQRCWRASWELLTQRHPILAAWFDQLSRENPDPIATVYAARSLVRNAVMAAWRKPPSLPQA